MRRALASNQYREIWSASFLYFRIYFSLVKWQKINILEWAKKEIETWSFQIIEYLIQWFPSRLKALERSYPFHRPT